MKIFSTIFLLLICFYSIAANSTKSSNVISSVLIDYPNGTKQVNVSRGGMEGWGHASFIVGLDGRPKDVVVFDYSGKDRYVNATKRYIEKLRYSPASIDGIPSLSHETFFLRHQFTGVGFGGNSVSPRFINEYQEVMNELLEPDTDLSEIKKLIYDLKDDHTKNLNEQALVAWLESLYFYKKEDFHQHMRQSSIITSLDLYVPIKILSKAIVNLYESELFYGYYNEAQETIRKMSRIDGLKLSDDIKRQLFTRVNQTIAEKEPTLVTKGQVWSLGARVIGVFKPKIRIINTQGKINSVELRCTGHHSKYQEGWEDGLAVPSHAKSCSVLVLGDPESTFDLVQTEANHSH